MTDTGSPMGEKNLSDNKDYLDISHEEDKRIAPIIEKMLEMGMGAVYGQEDEGVPDAYVDCEANIRHCKAICCTFNFALTKKEVQKGHIKHNTRRPFFIARDSDGYCPHLDRDTLQCNIWEERPLRCRRYDCREDPDVWPKKDLR